MDLCSNPQVMCETVPGTFMDSFKVHNCVVLVMYMYGYMYTCILTHRQRSFLDLSSGDRP